MGTEMSLKGIVREVGAVLKDMDLIVVKNDEQYAETADFCKRCKDTQKIVKAFFKEDLEEAKSKLAEIKEEQEQYLGKLENAEKIAKEKMTTYFEKKMEEKRKAEEREREKAEKKRQLQLEKLQEEGKQEEAERLEETELEVRKTKEVPKVENVSYREVWNGECVDLGALLKAVLNGEAPVDFITVNQQEIDMAARVLKKEMSICKGVVAVKHLVPVVR